MNNSNNNKQPLDPTDYDGISQADVSTGNLYNSDEASTTIPIIDPIDFLLGCVKKGGDRKKQHPPTICKVSRVLRDLSKSSFTPQLVSIGLIHREDPKLQEFEWLKECYLHDLIKRRSNINFTPEKTLLETCLQEVNTLIPKIRESYAGVKKIYSDVELATMMVMDGCFILEFCFKHYNEHLDMQTSHIAMDLLLLENQVPFFVLQTLSDCIMGVAAKSLGNILDKYLTGIFIIFHLPSLFLETTIHFDSDSTHDHVLGYLHKRYLQIVVAKPSNPIRALISKLVAKSLNPVRSLISKLVAKSLNPIRALISKLVAKSLNPIRALISKLVAKLNPMRALIKKLVDKKGSKNTLPAFHSVVELDRSGVNFKPHQESYWSMTIKFQPSLFAYLPWFKPTLRMPTLVIHDFTEIMLRNLIAYEQSFPNKGYYFTSYAYAMDVLIDTQEDIAKLLESKVLVNTLGTNQEAADMINKVCKNMIVKDFHYTDEFKQLDKYYNALWPRHIARLKRVYFNNPWNAIALFAAIILFALTVIQTVYAIKAVDGSKK